METHRRNTVGKNWVSPYTGGKNAGFFMYGSSTRCTEEMGLLGSLAGQQHRGDPTCQHTEARALGQQRPWVRGPPLLSVKGARVRRPRAPSQNVPRVLWPRVHSNVSPVQGPDPLGLSPQPLCEEHSRAQSKALYRSDLCGALIPACRCPPSRSGSSRGFLIAPHMLLSPHSPRGSGLWTQHLPYVSSVV